MDNNLNKIAASIKALSTTKKDYIVELIEKLFESRDIIHLTHLKTNSYAVHVALNDYYEGILDFADNLTESTQGCTGKLLDITIPQSTSKDPITHLTELKEYVLKTRNLLDYEFQKNITDEITALISKTLYKLKFLK